MWIFVIIVAYIEHFIEQFKRNNLSFLYKNVIANVRLIPSLTADLV